MISFDAFFQLLYNTVNFVSVSFTETVKETSKTVQFQNLSILKNPVIIANQITFWVMMLGVVLLLITVKRALSRQCPTTYIKSDMVCVKLIEITE